MVRGDLTFYEFFAGGGMARIGLGKGWRCLAANDICPKKARSYWENFPGSERHFLLKDVAQVDVNELPDSPALVWASFPCQDLSLAGGGAGLQGARSGTFWPFWDLMIGLKKQGRAPRVIALENVVGAITSHGGKDFRAIVQAAADLGYWVGALVVDAVHFVPQSRPRLFVVCVARDVAVPKGITATSPSVLWHPESMVRALAFAPKSVRDAWVWWDLPEPPGRSLLLEDLIENEPTGVDWHSPSETRRLLAMMSDLNRDKVRVAQRSGTRKVGAVYRRTRPDGKGGKVQRAEVRFDGISGCLRTPAGGSSRQTILVVEGKNVRSRLLSPREAARLMGVEDSYVLPTAYNEAYHLMGDGVVVPVVDYLSAHLLVPLAKSKCHAEQAA